MASVAVTGEDAPIRENLVRFLVLEGHAADSAADGLCGIGRICLQHSETT